MMKYVIKVEFNEDVEEEYVLDTEEEAKQLLQKLKGTAVSVKIYPTISGIEDVLTDIKERIKNDEDIE